MPYLYLIISVFMNASSSVFGTHFNRQNADKKDTSAFYNCLQMLGVFACWVILLLCDFTFDIRVLPYALLFALFFSVCNIGIINALKHGPATLTSLFVGLSLLLTTAWGFLFWNAKLTVFVGVGLALVALAVYLCLYTGKKDEKKISVKWVLFVLMALVGNSGCSITQRTQQVAFDGAHGNMLMACATLISALVCFLIWWRGDRTDAKAMLQKSWYVPVGAGVCNVILNICVMRMALTSLSPSLIYPTIGVGGLMVVTLVSLFVFKEKLKWQQWLGLAVGALATALLSL